MELPKCSGTGILTALAQYTVPQQDGSMICLVTDSRFRGARGGDRRLDWQKLLFQSFLTIWLSGVLTTAEAECRNISL